MELSPYNLHQRERFASDVMSAYRSPDTFALSKGLRASAELSESGHPKFVHLEVGERESAYIACAFLDLNDFTGRSYWDDADDLARLADAVLSGFTAIVTQLGGHVLGLRGDGLFAGFGPVSEPGAAVSLAGLACSIAIDGIQNGLNPRLRAEGIEPVKARAGVDYGEVVFVRSGVTSVNEVNIVGFAANFAAKAEKIANAWEVVVGQGFVDQLGVLDLVTRHEKSPKEFTRNYETERYHFYRYDWKSVLVDAEGIAEGIRGRGLDTLEGSLR